MTPRTEPIALTVSLFVPPANPAAQLLAELAETVARRSGGRLVLHLCPGEELGPTAAQFDLARTGAADIAYMMHGATAGRFPLTELAALPFVDPDPVAGTAALMRARPLLRSEHAGVEILFLTANAPMAVFAKMPLHTPADFRGKRIRHAGSVVAATLAALGAEPVDVMPLAVPAALADGTLDGTGMTYEGALVNGLARVVSDALDLYANTVTFALVMNAQRYRALPDDLRALVDEVLGESAGLSLARRLAEAAAHGRDYMRERGVRIHTPSPAERAAFETLIRPVVSETIAALERRGLPGEAVCEALRGSR